MPATGFAFLKTRWLSLVFFMLCMTSQSVVAQGRDFSGQQLSGRDYTGQQLDEADFSGAVMRGTVLRKASLRGADFRNADLRGADLSGADLTGADLRGAKMPINATGTKLAKAKLDGLDVSGSGFDRAEFAGASLQGTRGWASISGANFRGADLRSADLETAYSAQAIDLSLFAGAGYDGTTRWPRWLNPEMAGARRLAGAAPLTPGLAGPSVQPQSRASQAAPPIVAVPSLANPAPVVTNGAPVALPGSAKDLHGRNYASQQLEHADFRNANLQGADFTSTNLAHAELQNADLRQANLESARLSDANLSGADLRNSHLKRADFRDAKLNGANLEEQVLYLAAYDKLYAEMTEGYRKQGKEVPYAVSSILETAVRAGAAGPSSTNGTLSLRTANLRNTVVFGNMQGIDFRGADLRGADLSETAGLSEAFLRNAIYDSRTRWNIDPAKMGAVKGEDIGLPLRWFYATWGIDKKRDGEPDAPETGILRIAEDGAYEWNVASGHVLKGTWDALRDPDPKKRSVILHDGELGLEWIVLAAGADLLLVASQQGKSLARTGFRADQPAGPSK